MGVMDMMGEGFAGTTKGSFFEAPSWVNKEMAAGRTNQVCVAPTSPFFFHDIFIYGTAQCTVATLIVHDRAVVTGYHVGHCLLALT